MTATAPASGTGWVRLDPRMLLIHPVRELVRLLPAVLLALIAGTVSGEPWWTWLLLGLGTGVGTLRWATTCYQITTTGVQLRRGVLNRQDLTIPRARIRSVEIEQTLLHRIFGLSVMRIRTAAARGEDDLELNGIPTARTSMLRAQLLRGTPTAVVDDAPSVPPVSLVPWRPGWARYATFTVPGIAAVIGVIAFLGHLQLLDDGIVSRLPAVEAVLHAADQAPAPLVAVTLITALTVLTPLIAAVGYLSTYAAFQVLATTDRELVIRRGLLRTRQTVLDTRRLRGIELNQPLTLRLARGASLRAVMTGLGQERTGSTIICPPGPGADVARVAAALVDPAAVTVPLTHHGRLARIRRYTRVLALLTAIAVLIAGLQAAGIVSAQSWLSFAILVPLGAGWAGDCYRGLGHALTTKHLVLSRGSLCRRRLILETDGILGWSVRSSFFQRRVGLVTLTAATAAGRRKYTLPDVPVHDAAQILEQTTKWAQPSDESRASNACGI